MKTFFKYLASYIGLFIVLLGVMGGVGYHLYTNGWIEKTLSEIVIPFEWFGQSEIAPVGHLQVKDIDRRTIAEYKEAIEPLSSQIKEDYKTRPKTDDLSIPTESKEELERVLEKVYGVEYTYVSDVSLVGLLLTSEGWFGLMNFAVIGDTLTYNNIVLAFQLDDDMTINNLSVYLEDEQKFAYSEIPDDFDMGLIDQSLTETNALFTDISIESSKDPFIVENKQFLDNAVVSKLQFINSYVRIYNVYSVGTDEGVKEYVHIFHLDESRRD